MDMVIVNWYDVAKTMNDESFDKSINVDSRLVKMRTIGWLYAQSETVVLIVQEFSDGIPRDYVTIPKSLIIETIKVN
jgi:hypothetical protein